MTKTEYLSIGYIRSNCLSKVKFLIEELPNTRFYVSRSYTYAKKEDTGLPWMNFSLRAYRDLKFQWDVFKHNKWSYQLVLNKLNEMTAKYNFEDFVVEQFQVVISDNTLDAMVRKYVEVPEGVSYLATFRNNPIAYNELDGWSAEVVSTINKQSIKNLYFKKGVLDLVELGLFKDGKKVGIDLTKLLGEKEIVVRVLKNLDRKVWDELPEIKKIVEEGKIGRLDPGGVRTYEKISGMKWKFISDEGVN
jgi:hypothetical protein